MAKFQPLVSIEGEHNAQFYSMPGCTAAITAAPGVVQECRLGPPEHHKGPSVFLDYDRLELDAAYDQPYYEPLIRQTYDQFPPWMKTKIGAFAGSVRKISSFSISVGP
jgi:hypothetical protein